MGRPALAGASARAARRARAASRSCAASATSSTTSPTRTGSSGDDVLESLALLEQRRLILELPCVYPRHLGDVPELAARFPGLTIVIDHLGEAAAAQRRDGRVGRSAACRRGPRQRRGQDLGPQHGRSRQATGMPSDLRRGRRAWPSMRSGPSRLLCGSDWPVALLNGDYEHVWRETTRVIDAVAPRARRAAALGDRACASTTSTRPPRRRGRHAVTALTDQAIAKIKDLIMSGEFTAGSKLPNEQDLSQRLGLSRNSLREAVRALTLIGVLEPRVGDGTYVTSLEPELLLTGMGFISDLLTGSTLLELHQVRRILEPVATEMAATRLDEDDLAALERCLADMDAAETTQAFIAADAEFHGIIVAASGNSTLASLIQNLSGGTLRARMWRSVIEQDAIEADQAAPLGHLQRAARRRRRARARGRPDPPLRGRALARAADRGRGGDRSDRRIRPRCEQLRLKNSSFQPRPWGLVRRRATSTRLCRSQVWGSRRTRPVRVARTGSSRGTSRSRVPRAAWRRSMDRPARRRATRRVCAGIGGRRAHQWNPR